jgi:hypothetical protein
MVSSSPFRGVRWGHLGVALQQHRQASPAQRTSPNSQILDTTLFWGPTLDVLVFFSACKF